MEVSLDGMPNARHANSGTGDVESLDCQLWHFSKSLAHFYPTFKSGAWALYRALERQRELSVWFTMCVASLTVHPGLRFSGIVCLDRRLAGIVCLPPDGNTSLADRYLRDRFE